MMKKRKSLYYIIFLMLCLVLVGGGGVFIGVGQVNALDTENFYFDEFEADYYLSRDEEGVSHLKVDEKFTVVFPDYNQNKGICRDIPFTNQDGKNITLEELDRSNLTLTRNGAPEPIYSIDKYDDYFEVCTGDVDYVLGTQVYEFKYEFRNVVMEFDQDGGYQELYWDTNGTGWAQRFGKIIARLHFVGDILDSYEGISMCYVGGYHDNNGDRCTTSAISDGLEFITDDVDSFGNLTFAARIKNGTFNIPEVKKNYSLLGILGVIGAGCLFFIIWSFKKYLNVGDKVKYFKNLFIKPEYQPNNNYSLAEMAEIYLGSKKDMKVAMLLDLVVKKKIELKKTEEEKRSRGWEIVVKNLDGVGGEEIDLLTILNNGTRVKEGDKIKIERHNPSNRLITVRKGMESKIVGDLKKDGLVEDKYKFGESSKRGVANIIAMLIIFVPFIMAFGLVFMGMLWQILGLDSFRGEIVFERGFILTVFVLVIITVALCTFISDRTAKYTGHTMKGLEMSRYMDGLKLYIEMAEADRLKMLQSVEGADTSPEGLVKIYEKLLPYAAVFGLEESWMEEMKQYCEVQEIEEPNYLMTGFAASEISRIARSASSYAASSTAMSSGSGGSSSSFSGSGGGGFSGGGGGGGGGHGR